MATWDAIKKAAARGLDAIQGGAGAPAEGDVVVTQSDGVRYMTFGTEWVQGAMRLARPDHIELEYARRMMGWMLFMDHPRMVAQMGLGGGALAKFCLRRFPDARVEVVELDAAVAEACRIYFALPIANERFKLLLGDASAYALDPANHGRADALQVDVYDARAEGPCVGSPEFYRGCWDCLAEGGWMCVNLFGDHPGFDAHLGDIRSSFGRVLLLGKKGDGNVVAMARKGLIKLDMREIGARARAIQSSTSMPTGSWVEDLRSQREFGESV